MSDQPSETGETTTPLKRLVDEAVEIFLPKPPRIPDELQDDSDSASDRDPGPGAPIHEDAILSRVKPIMTLLNALTAEDVGLYKHYVMITNAIEMGKHPEMTEVPITFVYIKKTAGITIMFIIIPPGKKIPLHDHPGMTGLLKVLHGQIKVTSFTLLDQEDVEEDRIPAIKSEDTVLSKTSPPQLLTPKDKNVHHLEYHSGEGDDSDYAAIIDILSPSYGDSREGSYYSCENHVAKIGDKVFLTIVGEDDDGEYESTSVPFYESLCPQPY